MPRPKLSEQDLEERAQRKREWIEFRKANLFTQKKLAEVLGVSRRTVQSVEAGKDSPFPDTLRRFVALRAKYEQGKAA